MLGIEFTAAYERGSWVLRAGAKRRRVKRFHSASALEMYLLRRGAVIFRETDARGYYTCSGEMSR